MTAPPTQPEAQSAEEVRFVTRHYPLYGKLRAGAAGAPTILLLHGLGFHSFEYDALAARLAESGLGSLALDFRGHGRSEGPRGRWVLSDLVEDAVDAVAFLAQRADGPIGVYGNSLGAIVGIYLVLRASAVVGSLVASGCPTRVADFAVTRFRRVLLRTLLAADKLAPIRISVNPFIPYTRILRYPEVIGRVRKDRWIADARRLSPGTYSDMFAWDALEPASRISIPTLVLFAGQDRLQPVEQSTMLHEALRCQKELRGLDTGHVPNLEDPDRVAPILLDWFGRTLRSGGRGLLAQDEPEVPRFEHLGGPQAEC